MDEPARAPLRLRPDVLAVIAVGGSLGGLARYAVGRGVPTAAGRFPWATFAVNVSGAFVLAVLLVFVLEVWPPSRYVRPFFAIGFLGSFTTFSTWMLESDRLLWSGHALLGFVYLVGSLLAGLVAVSLGLTLGRLVGTVSKEG